MKGFRLINDLQFSYLNVYPLVNWALIAEEYILDAWRRDFGLTRNSSPSSDADSSEMSLWITNEHSPTNSVLSSMFPGTYHDRIASTSSYQLFFRLPFPSSFHYGPSQFFCSRLSTIYELCNSMTHSAKFLKCHIFKISFRLGPLFNLTTATFASNITWK